MSQYSVAVLHHETAPWDILKGSLLFALAKRWRNEGVTVHHLFGTRSYVGADVAFVHVGLSVVPDDYLEFARQYPLVVNLHGTDIRKRVFSMLRVSSPDSGYDGPVIVKTNLNDCPHS